MNPSRKIPEILKDPDLRYFLAVGKKPIEKKWNSEGGNNYPFFHSRLLNHKDNYGVCCGFGRLVVIDFDDYDYYMSVVNNLPITFTVKSAGKKMAHMYYYLKGEMFKKVGIDIDGKRVCDIQADGSGVIGPESVIGRQYYEAVNKTAIAEITPEELKAVFNFETVKRKKYIQNDKEYEYDVKEIANTVQILRNNKVDQATERHFRCPFHESESGKSLWINDSGLLHCFHCNFHGDIHKFIDELNKVRQNEM